MSFRFGVGISAAALVLGVSVISQAATKVADYNFNLADQAASSVAGAPDLSFIDSTGVAGSATASYNTDTVNGQTQPIAVTNGSDGLQVRTNDILPDNGSYSIVLLAKYGSTLAIDPTSTFLFDGKVLDFQNLTQDVGVYNGQAAFIFFDGAALPTATALGTSLPGTLTTDSYIQFVLTRTDAGLVSAYVGGAPAFSFTDTDNAALIGRATGDRFLDFLIDDNANPVNLVSENQSGNIANIQLFSGALTADEVAGLPEPTGVIILLGGAMMAGMRRRR